MSHRQRAALISVSNKTGLIEIAQFLQSEGFVLLSTRGTGAFLAEHGISVTSIEDYTGQKEFLDGRVKTLHPRIHGGLLARRDLPEHLAQLEQSETLAIDVALVNLYPFLEAIQSDPSRSEEEMVELIDIGGPTMIRAAAKNFSAVYPVIDPADYDRLIENLKIEEENPGQALAFRRELAAKVFSQLARYNLEIARFLSGVSQETDASFAPFHGQVLEKRQSLRYGENPHQRAALYSPIGEKQRWKQLQGKELSYNNLLDLDACIELLRTFRDSKPTAVILKHLNPCGAAVGADLREAVERAKRCDPRSHFGGILGFNQEVDEAVAQNVASEFAEIVVAPSFSEGARELFLKKKNLRVVLVEALSDQSPVMRAVSGGVLVQEPDRVTFRREQLEQKTSRPLQPEEEQDLELAWLLCGHVKSNAITIVRHGMLIGCGAGQMSRIDAAELAVRKAELHGHELAGAVAASDAFFPFPDNIELLAGAGIRVIIAPGGAMKDKEVVSEAEKQGVTLLFAPERHFRH